MKIYDCFTFCNELDVLDLRLNVMYEHVDKIVLVESTKTFNKGKYKPLYYNDNKEKFKQFSDKIIHIIIDDKDFPEGEEKKEYQKKYFANGDPQTIEVFQRNAISRGLNNIENDDIIIISDVDEIIKPEVLQDIKISPQDFFYFKLLLFYMKFNNMCVEGEVQSVWSMASRGFHIKNGLLPHGVRRYRFNHTFPNSKMYDFAGWHFSFIGDDDFIKNKLINATFEASVTPKMINDLDINNLIASGKDILNRTNYKWLAIQLDENFPEYLVKNQEKYSNLIFKNAIHKLNVS